MTRKPVYVTKPSLPPLEEFTALLEEIWSSGVVSNNGQFVRRLEAELCTYLDVEHLSLVNNGTTALLLALAALEPGSEVITTPFSFVATAHAIAWSGLQPVFVDIDPHTCNMDPARIEDAITPSTSAILPVHCYGTPCDIDTIQHIAAENELKIIYDAAHAFGVTLAGQSVLRHGDFSTVSFHATKVFNTFEGGAVIAKDPESKRQIDLMRNFGFANEETVPMTGINGKMSEVNAAFGIVQLRYIDRMLARRRHLDDRYRTAIREISGLTQLPLPSSVQGNGAYFPVLVENEYPLTRDATYARMKSDNIFGRRYFYPLISNLPSYRSLASAQRENLPVANSISERILCLPIYTSLSDAEQQAVIDTLRHPHASESN